MAIDGAALLDIAGLTKRFGDTLVLDKVDLALRAGEIHALLGENGAGKSTLIKTVTGVVRRDGGSVRLQGAEIDPSTPDAAIRAGIACVHQEVAMLPNLSVAQNLFLGREPTRFGLVRRAEMARRSRAILADFGLDIDVTAPLGSFAVAVQHLTAIARAVDLSARLLILDEPTASLDGDEVKALFTVLRRLAGRGLALLFVSHFLDQVDEICDRVTVLRNGRLVATRLTADLTRAELVELMLGRRLATLTHPPPAKPLDDQNPVLVRYAKVGRQGAVEPFDLELRRGQVVGLAGLLGSGRSETARLMFGADPADQGQVTMDGREIHIGTPRQAIRAGLAFLPEDRKTEGIVASLSVRDNIVLALQARRGLWRKLTRRQQDEIADLYIRRLDIRPADPELPLGLLSGGNQQKVLLARWLATEPKLLILDEPTRGIDIGAHAEIITLIRQLCSDGLALLVISSELEEIVAYASEVVVLRDHVQIARLKGAAISVPAIMTAIAGGGR